MKFNKRGTAERANIATVIKVILSVLLGLTFLYFIWTLRSKIGL
jgi:hypothetical protein